MYTRQVLAACLVAAAGFTSAVASLLPRASIPLLTADPWYDVDNTTLSAMQPGAIIRSRTTPGPIGVLSGLETVKVNSSYQLLFRTTDALGDPAAVAATIIIPYNAQFDKLLAYEAAYDSSDPNCAPSYTLQFESKNSSYDPLFMAGALEQGWVVCTADYSGLNGAFVAGLSAGYSTLDSVRAALQSENVTGILPNATYALWGYSGGALASEWAVELQPTYAPELNFSGAALGGLTPNVTNVVLHVNGHDFSWLNFAGINGLTHAYPDALAYIEGDLVPEKADEFYSINYKCTYPNESNVETNLSNQDISPYFKNGLAFLQAPVIADVILNGTMMGRRSTPTTPLYVYKAIGDEVSPVADTDALVKKYCANGASIEYYRNEVGEHEAEAVLGAGGAFEWLQDRLDGKAVTKGCSTHDVLIGSPADFQGFSPEILGALAVLVAQPLGPGAGGL